MPTPQTVTNVGVANSRNRRGRVWILVGGIAAVLINFTAASGMTGLATLTVSELRSYDFSQRQLDFGNGVTVQQKVIPLTVHDSGSVISGVLAATGLWIAGLALIRCLRFNALMSRRITIIATICGAAASLWCGYSLTHQPIRGGSEFGGMAMVAQGLFAMFAVGSAVVISVVNSAFLMCTSAGQVTTADAQYD